MGKAKLFEMKKMRSAAIECLNKIIVTYKDFHPAICEKAKLLLQEGEWEQASETAQRAASQVRICFCC